MTFDLRNRSGLQPWSRGNIRRKGPMTAKNLAFSSDHFRKLFLKRPKFQINSSSLGFGFHFIK